MTLRFLLDENITPLVRDIAVREYPQLAEQLHLFSEASEPTEWIGKQMWLPI